ncbi:MAG: glycosyltransferase [Chitinispirillaceae bacterium]|jgi:glycosyltransferase involved in cell wall biosynthesis|nr:glycosyltransferase [Chitinispirillaceae bacterium]
MFISIVIPTYNRPDALSVCLKALAPQVAGAHDTEIYVVDDASYPVAADRNRELCRLYSVNYSWNDKNSGVAATRNAGIRKSSGTWVVFIDDDFRVADTWYSTLCRVLSDQKSDTIGVEGAILPSGEGLWDKEVQNKTGGLFLTCHIAYKKNVLDDIGGFDENFMGPFCEDHELAARALRHGAIVFAPELSGVHQPRNVRLCRYVFSSFRRIRAILISEYYFFCKQPDAYHRFRHARTFWGTYRSALLRGVVNDMRRRTAFECVRHPIQFITLITAGICEMLGAWLLLPHFIREKISDKPRFFDSLIDDERTRQLWRLPATASFDILRCPASLIGSMTFPLTRRPAYDQRAVLRKTARWSSLDTCAVLLRIDDVFIRNKNIGDFAAVMSEKRYPYLAGITGDDLIDPSNAGVINALTTSGAEIAIHGFTHTGTYGPYASELLQTSFPELSGKLAIVAGSAVFQNRKPAGFIPPFNAVSRDQIAFLSDFFPVVTGGPETMRFTDRYTGPIAVKNGGWYVPSLFPYYSNAADILKSGVLKELSQQRGFVSLCLHMTTEACDGFASLRQLLATLPAAPVSWQCFSATSPEVYFQQQTPNPGPSPADGGREKQ